MDFWVLNVKCDEIVDVTVVEGQTLRIRQAALEQVIEGCDDTIALQISVNGEQRVLGALHHGRFPQQVFPSKTMFEENFKISHTSKDCGVTFFGYRAPKVNPNPYPRRFDFSDDEEDRDEEIPKMQQSGKKRPLRRQRGLVSY